MRRSRISIKPNVRPGGRAVGPTAETKTSQESVDNTQQTIKGEQIDRPPPSSQSHLEVKEPAVSTGDGNVPSCPSEKTSVNTGDRVPSSASTPAATALQRRNRISATPNLTRPKIHSVPRSSTGKAAASPSVPSKSSPETPTAISKDDTQTTATSKNPPSSPCLPSGCHEPYVKKTSVSEFPSSIKPHREPYQTPLKNTNEDSGSQESALSSPYVKLSRCDGPGSPLKNSEMSDKQRVLRALKLKELMKLETRKERMTSQRKRKSGWCSSQYSDEVDHSKMTLADFIYYLPETNPMRSSLSAEQTPAETTVPPSPKVPTKMTEVEEEEEEDDDDDGEDGLMVPKVRVAEDGSLILDEDSLTVRVQRTSDTVVENATPLFERGNATTYMSFRKYAHVKCWSVRETDMFYLAISMVGTDFSMMAQLLTHRTRAEIKSKFKKEEKTNAWRVDKAFRNKRPFDQEFFSFMLKKILEKDKDKGKSIKLVVKANKAKKRKGGKKSKKHKDGNFDDDDIDNDELDTGDLEKENEDSSNVKGSSTSKKCKRKRNTEPKPSSCEKTHKPSKNQKKSKQDEGKESESLHVEDESINAENEDPSLMTVSKKKRKRSRKSEEMKGEEEPEEKCKTKRKKELIEVQDEVPVNTDGENDQASTEQKSDTSETCKRSKKCKEEPAKGKRKTKKNTKSPEECVGEDELDAVGEVSTTGPDAEADQGEKLTSQTTAQEETQQNSSKRSKRPVPNLLKIKGKKCSEPKDPVEDKRSQDENCGETENELRSNSLAESQVQKQAVVVLERTPPRLIKTREWSESPDQPQTSQSLQDSPGQQIRAEKVKRNLTALEGVRGGTGKMDDYQTGSEFDTSAADMTMDALSSKEDIQESKAAYQHEEVEEHMDGPEEKSSSGVSLDERVTLHPEMKESGSCSSQPTEDADTLRSHCNSIPVEETINALNKCPDSLEEQPTSSETLKEKEIQDEKSQDGAQIIDENLSFTSDEETPTVNIKVVQEILSFLEKPDHLLTTPSDEDVPEREGQLEIDPAQTCKKIEQIIDLKDYDSDSETVTEEPLGLKRTTPTSCFRQSAEGSVVSAQQSIIPEWQSKPIPYLRRASQIMVNSQHTREPHEDSISEIANKPGCQSPAKVMHCELDLSMKDITEDKLVSCEVNLQKCEQAKGPKPTSGPSVPLENTATGKKETSDQILTDAIVAPPEICSQISPKVLGASFSDDPTAYSSNTCDMNTMLFCETTAEDVQISVNFSKDVNYMGEMQPLNTDSVQQNSAENLSKAFEDFNAPLKGNADLEMMDSAGMESDNQTEEEPTFILTLYEIPTSQLFHETSYGHQDVSSFDLQPAEVLTPQLLSGQSQSIPSTLKDTSSLLHMKSEEIEKHVSSVSQKVVDDLSIPESEDSVNDASLQSGSSQKSSFDVDTSLDLGGSQEILSCNASVPTDVTSVVRLYEKPSESTETKASSQRRSRIKVKPNLRPCVKAGPSKAGPSKCALMQKTTANVNLPTSYTVAKQVETESNQKTSSQETVGFSFFPNIHSDPEESERETHPGHDSVLSTTSLPASEDIKEDIHMKWKNIFNTDILMGNGTALDLSVKNVSDAPDLCNTDIEEAKEEVEDVCEGSSHLVLVDAFALASGDMEDTRLLKAFENRRLLPTDKNKKLADVSKEPEASGVTSVSQDETGLFLSTWTKDESSIQKQSDIESNQTLQSQIKEEIDKVEERTEQEDFCDLFGDLGTMLTLPKEVIKTKQQLTDAMTSTLAETQPVEEKTTGEVLPDMFVEVTEEKKDEVYMKSESSVHHHLQSCEVPFACAIEKQQNLTKEEDQEMEEHEAVSHMMLGDIFVPVSEGVGDNLCKEMMTFGEESSHLAKRSQVKEHPDISNTFCAVSELNIPKPSVSPKKRMATKKGLLKVKMNFPKRRSEESASTSKRQDVYNLQSNSEENKSSTKNSAPFGSKIKETLTCADQPYAKSSDTGEACEGVSHIVLSDILVPALDESHETTKSHFHQEALLVEESVTEIPSDTKRKVLTASRSAEQNIPSCRRAHSLDTQAEDDWSLKSDMLPVDSNEIENWCEGVSHMLLSDAFVPVSEEENITDQKGFGASGPRKDREYAEHQLGSISGMQKTVEKLPASQTKTSPGRQSTFQMTLRSPGRSPKNAVPKTPQRANISKENIESRVQTPTKSQKIAPDCRIQLERLSLEEICQHNLQPKHHSTPVNVKHVSTFSKGHESRMAGLASHAAQEPAMLPGAWPKVVLNRVKLKANDADSSTPTSSPARASTSAYRPLDDYQSPHSNTVTQEPASVSQFFLDDIFTEVVDAD